jgi:hypothetical protein
MTTTDYISPVKTFRLVPDPSGPIQISDLALLSFDYRTGELRGILCQFDTDRLRKLCTTLGSELRWIHDHRRPGFQRLHDLVFKVLEDRMADEAVERLVGGVV